MSLRHATEIKRRRESIKFEQERTASLDHEIQRAGGTHKKDASKESKQGSKSPKPEDKSSS